MRHFIHIFTAGLFVAACANLPQKIEGAAQKTADFVSSVRPVEQKIDSDIETVLAMQRAMADYQARRYEDSFDGFQIIALKEPDNLTARIGLGNAALALNFTEKAYEIFSNRTALDAASREEKYEILAGLVLAEVATGRADDAEVSLNAGLEYNLGDTRLWNALGRYHDDQKSWRNARRTYLKALHADSRARPTVTNNLGMSFLQEGRYDLALEKFEQASALKKDRELYDNNRRLTLALMMEYDQATENVSDERAASILNDAGYIALTHERYDEAKTLLERSIESSDSYNLEATENLKQLKDKLASLELSSDERTPDVDFVQPDTAPDWGELFP